MFMHFLREVVFSKLLRWNYDVEIPTSMTSLLLKSFFLFIKIRSMRRGFDNWKQVGLLIKYSRSKVFMNFSGLLFSTIKLKSPIKIAKWESPIKIFLSIQLLYSLWQMIKKIFLILRWRFIFNKLSIFHGKI